MALSAIKVTSVRDSVAGLIRTALRSGRYQPGDPLSEGVMAAELEVSRGPVREALLVLVEEGLVSHTQNRGFSVPHFTSEDCNNIFPVRLALETIALVAARERVSSSDLARLEKIKNRMVELFRTSRPAARDGLEIDFHCALPEISGNSWLFKSMKQVVVPQFTFGCALNIQRPDLTAEAFAEQHDRYLRYLRGDSTYSAEECVRFHLAPTTAELGFAD